MDIKKKKYRYDTPNGEWEYEISEKIKQLIGYEKPNQVANKIGVANATVGKWLLGETIPTIKAVYKLCVLYDVESDWLLCLMDDED